LANETQSPVQSKDAEVAFFDQVTQEADYDVFTEAGYERILGAFATYLEPQIRAQSGSLEAVDLGCGTGAFTARLRRFNLKLHGVDISPQSIARAKQRYPEIDFRVGDIEATSFANDAFDVVFLSGVLHHFPDLRQTVAECGRILKPGGIALAFDPHRGNPVMWAYRCKDSPFYSSKGVTPNEQPLSKATLTQAFRVEPFAETRVEAISGITYKYIASRAGRLLLPAYNFVERCFDLPVLRRRFGSFLITYARKRS
jgi:SAM-dependent methyltransferase